MRKNLIIVESPAKAKTIESYVGKDYTVASCNGHIRDLPKKTKAINVEQGFQPTYEISAEKKQVVKALKQLADKATCVYLASDDDREGESISWHLKEALALSEAKTKRIVFREITQNAILQALQNPRDLDLALVHSQQARRVLDRLVGYDLSPLLWKKIKTGLSAGRVQSVAVRLVVERERAIHAFKPTASFAVTAQFTLDQGQCLHAELSERFQTAAEAYQFLEKCKGATFSIQALTTKTVHKAPAPPFTTVSLQQEASRKLGYAVARTMLLAQQLYETGQISYMRTDAVSLSQEAVKGAQQAIQAAYGTAYFQHRTYQTKVATAQEAHEAVRPTDFSQKVVSPDSSAQRLYALIWKRALASQMANAQLEQTLVTIGISTVPQTLLAKGTVVKFEGFLKVYSTTQDEEETQGMLPALQVGQVLPLAQLTARERFTKPPARYTEASLVKHLEEQEIGRPSTYVPIIATIQQRGYILKESRQGKARRYHVLTLQDHTIKQEQCLEIVGVEKQKLFPTDIAAVVTDFLVARFSDVTDYRFTAQIEQQLDAIAQGGKVWHKMLAEFYDTFYPKVIQTAQLDRTTINTTRLLGQDPATGKPVTVRLGRYGPLAQLGQQEATASVKFASLRKDQRLETITLVEALDLFKLPSTIGNFEASPMVVHMGRFGPYIKHNNQCYGIPKEEDPLTLTEVRAIALIQEKRKAAAARCLKTFAEDPAVQILQGRWGPYLQVGLQKVRLPKDMDPQQLTLDACRQFIETAPVSNKRRKKSKSA